MLIFVSFFYCLRKKRDVINHYKFVRKEQVSLVFFFDTSVLKESLVEIISAEMQQNENKAAICGQVSPLFLNDPLV